MHGLIDNITVASEWESYFETCKPATCTYTEAHEPPLLTVFIAAIGIAGGLKSSMEEGYELSVAALAYVWAFFFNKDAKQPATARTVDPARRSASGTEPGAEMSTGQSCSHKNPMMDISSAEQKNASTSAEPSTSIP